MLRIPCLKENGRSIFSITAEQRCLLGEEVFSNTHFPMSTYRFNNQKRENKSDEDILRMLINLQSVNYNNRVFIIYGAAGSGKSEFIRWLELQIRRKEPTREVFRISRVELDPVVILSKLLSKTNQDFNKDTIVKWEILKQKPVTLANNLVWNALNSLFELDDIIVPLSYKMRPLIERNLRESFKGVRETGDLRQKSIDLLSLEDFEDILQNCVLPFSLEYEQFRDRLIEKLEQEILGEYRFISTLKNVGAYLYKKTNKRPLLLIDDLVQSMNLYASDLLDYFITPEQGEWDVVIGVTPSYFESTKRGRELLTRINYLDTFDDRIYKLWLTDESGNHSYSVNADNVNQYLEKYFVEYKKQNGFNCNEKCYNYHLCLSMHWGNSKNVNLTPLNEFLIQRIYANLPKGKGQARQLIVTVGDFLDAIAEGKEVDFLTQRIKREKFSDVQDPRDKVLLESYLPFEAKEKTKFSSAFHNLLDLKTNESLEIKILDFIQSNNEPKQEIRKEHKDIVEYSAVKDWLEDSVVNKELLKPLRFSIGKFISEFVGYFYIMRKNTSRLQSILKYEKIIQGLRLPLSIQDIDDFNGIAVKKSLGQQALFFLQLDLVHGESQEVIIENLFAHQDVREIFEQAISFNSQIKNTINKDLKLECDEFAFLLYVFVFHITEFSNYPLIISKTYKMGCIKELPKKWGDMVKQLSEKDRDTTEVFFKDWFQLRDKLYDGVELKKYTEKYSNILIIIEKLDSINPSIISKDFYLGLEPARDYILRIITLVRQYKQIFFNPMYENEYKFLWEDLAQLGMYDKWMPLPIKIEKEKNSFQEGDKYLNIPDKVIMSDYKEWFIQYKEIKYCYPILSRIISEGTKTRLFVWFEKTKVFLLDLIQQYENNKMNLAKECDRYRLGLINDREEFNSGLVTKKIEPEHILKYYLDVTTQMRLINKRLFIIEKHRSVLSPLYILKVKDFIVFYNFFRKFLNKQDANNLQIDYHYNYYQNLLLFIQNLPNIQDCCEPPEKLPLLLDDSILVLKKKVCDLLIRQITIQKTLIDLINGIIQVDLTIEDKLIIELKGLIKKNQFSKYHLIEESLIKHRKSLQEMMENINKNNAILSIPAKMFLINLTKGNIKLQLASFGKQIDIFQEVLSTFPELKLELNVSLKV